MFLHKKSEALDLLTEARLERRFRSASTDLDRLNAGFYIAELTNELTDENDPNPELFDLVSDSLIAVDEGNDTTGGLIHFELKALELVGHKPMLNQCVGCGRNKQFDNLNVHFGLTLGGILCAGCRKGKTRVVNLSARAWNYLQILASEQSDGSITAMDGHFGEIRQFMNQYIAHHLGHRPRMQKYLPTGNQ